MAAFLAVTERIKVGSGVVNNWTRNPALLASTFSTLDDLAPGPRHPRDRRLVGAACRARSASTGRSRSLAMRETIEAVRALLADETVTYDGRVRPPRRRRARLRPPGAASQGRARSTSAPRACR